MLIIVDVYDPYVKKVLFKMIEVDRFFVDNFPENKTGTESYTFLSKAVRDKGFSFKFFSYLDEDTISVTVHNYGSPGSELYPINHLKP